jgi:siroheme synthase-like protein
MSLFLNIDIKEKECFIIGAGNVAYRKIKKLLSYGAKITVISQQVKIDEILNLAQDKKIRLIQKRFQITDLLQPFLVVLATDNAELNQETSRHLMKKNILVNNVNGKGNCTLPADYQKGALQIAVSTNGTSPLLAAKIRDKIVSQLPEKTDQLLQIMEKYRNQMKEKHINIHSLFDNILDAVLDEHLNPKKTEEIIQKKIADLE